MPPRALAMTLLYALVFPTFARAADERPNVVVILADDQGWGDLSVHGNTNLKTPNVDSLARDGALFERFYVCPVCSPTRAEFLTGRYHPRGGVRNVTSGGERLDLDERTVADAFRAAGYATGAFGKWHNGSQYPYHPNGRGFAEYYGFTSGHWGDYFDPPLEHNGRVVRGKGYITDDLTDHAVDFIKANRDRPFFCYLAFNTPHSPMQVPDRFLTDVPRGAGYLEARPPAVENQAFTRAALAMCENIDENVGRVLKSLDDQGLARRTVVLYFSDNGPNAPRWNDGMRGIKGSTDEGGVRSPLLVRWPGHIPPGKRVTKIAAAIDLLPTLTELAGLNATPGKPLDGRSLAPLLLGRASDWPDRLIFSHWAGQVGVRSQTHRLDAMGRLYDMERDPEQSRDASKDQPEVATRLREAVGAWRRDVLAELTPLKDDRPFPVGRPEFPVAHLPARDGVPHGKIRRSAPAPNCSYFTNWTSPDDSITWDVEAAAAGRYEAVLYYTCTPADVGVTLELEFQGRRLRHDVTEAHDPPARGAEHDRVPRKSESYVKDFRPLTLGTVDLPAGRGPLTLRAPKIPGQRAVEVRALTLTLVKP